MQLDGSSATFGGGAGGLRPAIAEAESLGPQAPSPNGWAGTPSTPRWCTASAKAQAAERL